VNYPDAIAYLDAHIGRGVDPGLERIAGLLDLMGNPEAGYPIVHIAGTNGKTSTARIATMLAVAHGLTTGTFISPHLERIEERLSLNGVTATPEQFAQAVQDVAAFADLYEERSGRLLTYFELTAAMAFAWFADQAVDLAIVEVGLGGRLDATNAARASVAVVTGIGLDHTEILGDTLGRIATEKLAIVEPGSNLVCGPLLPEAMAVAERVARDRTAALFRYGREFTITSAARAVGGWHVEIDGLHAEYEDLYLPLHGRHQTINLAVAVAAVEALLGRALDVEAVRDGLAVVTSPGRMEPIATDPLVLLDGAHNADGFRVLAAALAEEFAHQRWVLVVGFTGPKDPGTLVAPLDGRVDHVIAAPIESPRAVDPGSVAARVSTALGVEGEAAESVEAALDRARAVAGDAGSVLVTGSLYLVGAARSALLGQGTVHRNER
jgi:dihydrofolate synthase / folylpolyglutamate synthase